MNKYKILLTLFLELSFCFAQEKIDFKKPSNEIMQLADFERAPSVYMTQKKDRMIFAYRSTYKTLEDLNQDEMKLGGIRFNPNTLTNSTLNYINNLKVKALNAKYIVQVSNLPNNPQIAYLSLSPNEKFIAFTNTTQNDVELWTVDLQKANAKKITTGLNAVMGKPFNWMNDSNSLLIKTKAKGKIEFIDKTKEMPTGPTVSTSNGKVSQTRTYQDLLADAQDEANFITAVSSSLKWVDLNGNIKKYLPNDLYTSTSLSPDGKYFLIETIKKPFSYLVGYHRFPKDKKVYDLNGNLVKLINESPLDEVRPKGFSSTKKGKRNIAWRSDKAAEIYYVEALDEGDAAKDVPFREQVFVWKAPFKNNPKTFLKTKLRFGGIEWGNDKVAFVYDYWYDSRELRTTAFNPKNGKTIKFISTRNFQDRYNDPGNFYKNKNEFGKNVIHIEKNKAYLFGDGFTKNGQFPFLNELNLKNFKTKRIYTSKKQGKIESLVTFIDVDKKQILTRVESPNEYPNYYNKSLKNKKETAITQFKNPFESIKNVKKEVIHYKRNDDVDLSGTLYLPADYNVNSGEKLPLLIWAYPTEYKDKSTAGQNTQNPNAFTYPYYGSFVYWVAKGYAVLDDASFPIVGEGKTEPNDSFIPQLLANGKAAIDAVDSLGYIDRKKVAVGGHSYGAFMTANLLTHGDDFKCGIARSGAYNRTLTPFGFQSEQRNYWDNPDLYNTMSPFMNAHKMKKPMLLVHGEADNNPGTFTLQTERYFQALKNLGAPVRMVILPKESHGYRAKENILHLLWEQDQFLEKCLKN